MPSFPSPKLVIHDCSRRSVKLAALGKVSETPYRFSCCEGTYPEEQGANETQRGSHHCDGKHVADRCSELADGQRLVGGVEALVDLAADAGGKAQDVLPRHGREYAAQLFQADVLVQGAGYAEEGDVAQVLCFTVDVSIVTALMDGRRPYLWS